MNTESPWPAGATTTSRTSSRPAARATAQPRNRAKGILTDEEYFKLLADRFAYGAGAISVDGVTVEPSRPFPGPASLDGDVVRVPSLGKRTRVEVPPDMKWCPRCTRVLPLDAFGKHKGKPDGLTSRCRECNAEVARLRRS